MFFTFLFLSLFILLCIMTDLILHLFSVNFAFDPLFFSHKFCNDCQASVLKSFIQLKIWIKTWYHGREVMSISSWHTHCICTNSPRNMAWMYTFNIKSADTIFDHWLYQNKTTRVSYDVNEVDKKLEKRFNPFNTLGTGVQVYHTLKSCMSCYFSRHVTTP